MSAKLFWNIFFLCYCAQEVLCLLSGLGVLPRFWLVAWGSPAILTTLFAMMIEEWPVTLPRATDTRWHSGLGVAGILYPVPLVLAMAGHISRWLVAPSITAFAYLALRLVWLRLRCLQPRDGGHF